MAILSLCTFVLLASQNQPMTPDGLSVEYLNPMDLPNVIVFAAPVMVTLVVIEWMVSLYQNKDSMRIAYCVLCIACCVMPGVGSA